MSWHAGDFHFFLQIAPFHNKNTMHIRLDMCGGKMEMFILLWSLTQQKSLSRRIALEKGEGVLGSLGAAPMGSPRWAGWDEPELWAQHCLGAPSQTPAGPARQALAFSRALQSSSDAFNEARPFAKKLTSREHLEKKRLFIVLLFFFPKFSGVSSCQWGYSTQGALHALGLAGLRTAEQSPVEPSRAEPSVLSPSIHSLSAGAVVASRELQQRSFPHPLPPSVCLPWQKSSTFVTSRCPHPSSSEALFIFPALMPW